MTSRITSLAIALLLSALPVRAQMVINQVFYVGSATNCDFHDVQDAVSAAAAGDIIYIAAAGSPYARHISINKSLRLVGTDVCGNATPPAQSTPFATVTEPTGNRSAVIAISGTSDVTISGLEITGGHPSDTSGYGGGIAFFGSGGSLHLSNDVIHHNTAWRGGGIAVHPPGTTLPNIYLDEDVQVYFNTTTDAGAGIYVDGRTELYVMGAGDFIAFNTATASGGGLFIRAPAHAALGSPGLNGALIAFNQAQYGGGIAAYADDYFPDDPVERQIVSIFATDAHSPGQIADNTAAVAGGGIYTKPFASFSAAYGEADVCAQDFVVDGNVARDGAAIYKDTDSEGGASSYSLNTSACRSASTFNAVHCEIGVACNEISGNAAIDASGNVTANGSIVNLGAGYSLFDASTLKLQGNIADHLFNTFVHGSDFEYVELDLERCLTGGNTLSRELIRMEGEGHNFLSIRQCTFAPDVIDAPHVISFDNASERDRFTLRDTIIDEPGTLTVNYPGGLGSDDPRFHIGNVISNDITTLPGAPVIVQAQPLFVDAANGNVYARDYHLRAFVQNGQVTGSPGIDAAPVGEGASTDLDGASFDQDVPGVHDFSIGWFRDLGAYEAQPIADRIFCDAFGDPMSVVH